METNLSASIKTSTQNKPEEGFSSALLHNLLETDKPPWGALVFEQDGSVSSLCADGEIIGEENAKHIMIALDFAHYAFDRPDWMMEFIRSTQDQKSSAAPKPALRLIQGGLDDDE